MNEDEIRELLEQYGYPPQVVRAGSRGLIGAWRKFVEAVERGYESGLAEYRNDLDTRGIIARLDPGQEVRDLDARFTAMLTRRELPVWTSTEGDPFWIYGYPKNAGEELLADLQAEGLA